MSAHCACGAAWKGKAAHCRLCHRTFVDSRTFLSHVHDDDGDMIRNKQGHWGKPAPEDNQGVLL